MKKQAMKKKKAIEVTVMKKKKIEVTIEKDPVEEYLKPVPTNFYEGSWHNYLPTVLTDFEIRVVRITAGDKETVVETTFVGHNDFVVPRWLRYIGREHLKRRAPLLAAVSYYTTEAKYSWGSGGEFPARFKFPIRFFALCLGGSHCVVYEPGDPNCDYEWDLDRNPFRRLLEDRNITVVGVGMKSFAVNAKQEWGVHVANPVDLRALVGEAVGERKLMSGMELEDMAEAVLDGVKVRKKPQKIKRMLWGYKEIKEEVLKYVTCDAYLTFETGKKCLEMLHRKI